jgi:ATP-binding cassette, subfamily C, bacterial
MDAMTPKRKPRRASKVSVPEVGTVRRLSKSRTDAGIEVDRSISQLDQIIEDMRGPEVDRKGGNSDSDVTPESIFINGQDTLAEPAIAGEDQSNLRTGEVSQPAPHVQSQFNELSDPAPQASARQEMSPPPRQLVSIEGDSEPIRVSAPRQDAADASGGRGGKRYGGNEGGPRVHKKLGPQDFSKSLKAGIQAVRRNLTIVMFFTLFSNILVLAIPIYLFQISDRVFLSRSVDTLVMLTIVIVGAVVLQALIDALRRFILMRTAVEVAAQLGTPILTAAARAALHSNGREYQTLGDLQQLRGFLVSGTLLSFLDAPFVPIFVLAIYLVHPHLGFIVIGTALFLLVIALMNQKATSKPFGEANNHQSKANLHLESMSRNSQIINAMAMIPEAVKIWGRDTASSLSAQIVAQDRNIAAAAISKMVRLLTQVALLGWGAYLSLNGEITGGMVIAGSIIAGRALAPIEGAIEGWNQYVLSRGAYDRIKVLLQSSAQNYERLNLPNPEGRLDVERLLYVPQGTKRVVLNGISFTLMPGESMAIIGNSGAGKTTVGKMLVGSIMPTSGNVRLDLMDLRNWDQRQFGENIGYLPQDIQLFPGTIKDNIGRMREDALDADIYSAAMLADVHEMIASLPQGYETVVAADGAPLSGGQKQRIALARAFYGNPKFVVLDEPNSNLDGAGDEALARALTHAKQQKITVVAITQKSSLLKCIDKIILMANGTIALSGHRNDVLKALAGQRGQPGALQAQLS